MVESQNQNMLERLAAVKCLPSPPQVALKIVEACQDPEGGLKDLVAILALDPALSAQVVRIANSAAYSRGREITSVQKAIMVLGAKKVSVVALGFSLKRELPRCSHGHLDDAVIWRHSVATAVAASAIARLIRFQEGETAFLCGMLSRIGQLVLLAYVSDEYAAAVEQSKGVLPSIEDELGTIGITHHEAGRLLLEKWNLPEVIRDVIRTWGKPGATGLPAESQTLCGIVEGADAVRELLFDRNKASGLQNLHDLADRLFEISPNEMERMFLACEQELRETLQAFDDADAGNIDCGQVLEAAREQLVQVSLGLASDLDAAQDNACELALANRNLHKAVHTDPLTSLPNRAALDEELAALQRSRSGNGSSVRRPFSIAMIDVDHFKRCNDTYGHPAGDQVLQTIGATLSASARATDFIARYGGEEFTVILSNAGRDEAEGAAERYREAIEQRGIELTDKTVFVTASFGVATSDSFPPGTSFQKILQAADHALYQAKSRGRNRVVVFDPAFGEPELSATNKLPPPALVER